MHLITYLDPNTRSEKVGIRTPKSGGTLIDFEQAYHRLKLGSEYGITMMTLVAGWERYGELAARIVQAHDSGTLPTGLAFAESDAQLLAPIPRPVSMRDGYAFRQHVESARKSRGLPMIPEFDQFPVFYFTNHLAVTGPGPVRVQRLAQERLDFELEVAIVIGRETRNVSAAQADNHIFGYLIMNDWSARALQAEEMKLNLGPAKGKDFATSLGPYLVPREALESKRLVSDRKSVV